MLSRAATPLNEVLHPACRAALEGGGVRIVVSGDWTLAALGKIRSALDELGAVEPRSQPVEIDLGQLQILDTAGALALVKLRNSAGGERTAFINERREHRIL